MQTTKKDYFLTSEGIARLQDELHDLTTKQRSEVAAKLKEAKEYGDLSENIQWDDAKDRQAFIEGRIAEVENILKHSVVIEATESDVVTLGSTVHLELEDGEQHTSHRFSVVCYDTHQRRTVAMRVQRVWLSQIGIEQRRRDAYLRASAESLLCP